MLSTARTKKQWKKHNSHIPKYSTVHSNSVLVDESGRSQPAFCLKEEEIGDSLICPDTQHINDELRMEFEHEFRKVLNKKQIKCWSTQSRNQVREIFEDDCGATTSAERHEPARYSGGNFKLLHGNIFLQQSKRYAGHSKWQNIKHVKQEKDAERSIIFMNFRKRMKVAIAEGGSAKPSENSQLASLVEQAKKANMPVNSINTFLEKMSKRNGQSYLLEMRTVGGAIMILHLSTDNLVKLKADINAKIKKLRCQVAPASAKMLFDYGRYITTKKDCSLDEAMNDAINIGAEDVEQIKENDDTYFKFKCSLEIAVKIPTQLKSLNYTIIEMETICVPKNLVELDESDLEEINTIKKKLLEIESIEKIEDNIA